ncbi:MAG: SH3 domain-containing protein [Clostridiales bacterium]|nr:SH3 domain-containing protein [Clostridiales bacterium]
MKKFLAAVLILSLITASVVTALAYSAWGTSVMYVKTANGKPVNVRSGPGKGYEAIGSAPYGHQVLVDWSYAGNDGWTKVVWGGRGDGYIMSRFLVDYDPGKAPTPSKEEKEKQEAEAEKKKLDKELKSERAVSEYFYIAARPTRASGWVNLRSGPSKTTSRISFFGDGKELLVMGETTNWYRVQDPDTQKVGYVHKSYTSKLGKKYVAETQTTDGGVQQLGTLNVNGEFDLTCKLPEGYNLQVLKARGDRIVAAVLSQDMTKPQLYLSIAYDETYADVERMNDMNDDDLLILEDSFKDMNDVEISYEQTGYGTKLLVAKETGTDTDFVDILAVYKGYFVEFNMTPNPKAADQTLSDAQIRMCIDFLTDVDFNPAK